jgi:hypothetical protein
MAVEALKLANRVASLSEQRILDRVKRLEERYEHDNRKVR